jgi:putative alpha-1,2-mannosidase
MTGQTTFLVLAPWFEHMVIDLGDKKLEITTTGGDRNATTYVQSLRVNGQASNKSWVSWDDIFAGGGTLDFVLGTDKVEWSTGDIPPSPASGNMSSP